MKPTDFSKSLTDYLGNYLPGERGVSANTIKAYKDTFVLFLRFMQSDMGLSANSLMLKNITQEVIIHFLDWLETKRGCGISTRNARLATLHSFFHYLQYRSPILLHGHSSIATTEVYARADTKLKREALEKAHNLIPDKKTEQAIWLSDSGIMDWLKQIT